MRQTRLMTALDTSSRAQAEAWIDTLGDTTDAIKLGMEFTYAAGFDAVASIARRKPVFLDLKLHDIPNTVRHALASLLPLGATMLTIHASGGSEMVRAAREALDAAHDRHPAAPRPLLLAVTVLTSMDAAALAEGGIPASPRAQVLRLGRLAVQSGADGLVCSAEEIRPLREALGEKPVLVVPGIRPAGADRQDQKRVMTPGEASRAGADWIVVGRPITTAADPAAAARAIRDELRAA